MTKKRNRNPSQWYTIDLHIHTPASSDYHQPEITNLDILHRAEAKGLDMIALTDHNTVAGYRRLYEEIHQLELLEELKRILPDEQARLSEYRRLMNKILVLPGFEFTATFGFHILAIFPPEKPVREIEHLLLDLNIPPEQIDNGSPTVGATSDVLTAYRLIQQAGGLVIAAHANSSNGVAMRGFPLGGQTKIAYTQDENLDALEVTDLEHQGRHTSAAFFSGTKPEYPRRMHCIQGSDAHQLDADPTRKKHLGVGDRTTDILVSEVGFETLKDLFSSNDFARTRPHRKTAEPAFDFILAAREEGANIIQDFHDNLTVRGGKRYAIIADVCAFANTNGGTLYIGISADLKGSIVGIQDTEQAINQLEKEISNRISPPLQCTIDSYETGKKKIIRVLVPRGNDPPYAIDDSKIYVRSESETGLAVRDEIVSLVLRGPGQQIKTVESLLDTGVLPLEAHQINQNIPKKDKEKSSQDNAPHTGVEVVSVEERDGVEYYTMRDLRNGSVVKNVTPKSARRLWHYAITSYAKLPQDPQKANFQWQGEYGLMHQSKQGKSWRYDLIQKIKGNYRYFFGVTDDGIHGPWKSLIGEDED